MIVFSQYLCFDFCDFHKSTEFWKRCQLTQLAPAMKQQLTVRTTKAGYELQPASPLVTSECSKFGEDATVSNLCQSIGLDKGSSFAFEQFLAVLRFG